MVPEEDQGAVLVVDDAAANRELLRDLLEARGFEVREAADGPAALAALENVEGLPDAVLLDVMMPGLDGFEVCRRIKQNPPTAHLPVLMVTALADRASRLRGISEGATDILTKPLDVVDTHLRVRNAVMAKKLYDQLALQNQVLLEAEQARDSLVHMIVHDLKAPLTSVLGYCKLLKRLARQRKDEQELEFLHQVIAGGQRTVEMVDTILSVSRLEAGQMVLCTEPTDIGSLLREVEASARFLADGQTSLEFDIPSGITLSCDPSLIRRVLLNLIDNALRFANPTDRRVKVSARRRDSGRIELRVEDNGKGISPDQRAAVFDKFSQAAGTSRRNHGLGLAFCRLAVERHGGRIWIEGEPGRGAVLCFTIDGLPDAPTKEDYPRGPAE